MKTKIIKYWKPLAAVSFWGFSFVATKIALSELEPLVIIFLRLLFAVIFLVLIAFISKKDFSINLKNHGWIFILALIAAFHLWIQVTGLQFTTASNTGWIIGITPVFMAILGIFFFKENLTFVRTTGIIIAFFGLLLLISKGDFSSIDLISNKGDYLVLGSAFTWSVYSAVNKKISVGYSPIMTILYLFLMVVIFISPFIINESAYQAVLKVSYEVWLAIIFLGVFCSGIAYVFWARSLRELESVKVGAFLYFEPFVTVFASWILLSERITFLIMLSGIIITIGVILVNINFKSLLNKLRLKSK